MSTGSPYHGRRLVGDNMISLHLAAQLLAAD